MILLRMNLKKKTIMYKYLHAQIVFWKKIVLVLLNEFIETQFKHMFNIKVKLKLLIF